MTTMMMAGAEMHAEDWLGDLRPTLKEEDPEAVERAAAERATHRSRERMRRLERTIPELYRWARFDECPELSTRVKSKVALDRIRVAAAHSRLLFMGPSGAGKTSCAAAMLRERVATFEEEAMFINAVDLGVVRIQTKAGSGEARIVEEAMRAPLILIDDLGIDAATANSAVVHVIFERHARDLPTWVTTGLDSKQLVTRYGAGFLRRIVERTTILGFEAQMALGGGQ